MTRTVTTSLLTDTDFFRHLQRMNFKPFQRRALYVLKKYGTRLACNRFDVGNCIEHFFAHTLTKSSNLTVNTTPHGVRTDIAIEDYDQISLKYSSTGDIKLVNSLGPNREKTMHKTIVITPRKLYFLTEDLLSTEDIDYIPYLKDTRDGLALKRSLLTRLNKNNYPFSLPLDLTYDKAQCENKQCFLLVAEEAINNCPMEEETI
jgi:hypothetical protein